MDILGERLRQLRKLAKLSQEAVADELNVDMGRVSRWETGKRAVPPDVLVRLATLYGADDVELLRLRAVPKERSGESGADQSPAHHATRVPTGAEVELGRLADVVDRLATTMTEIESSNTNRGEQIANVVEALKDVVATNNAIVARLGDVEDAVGVPVERGASAHVKPAPTRRTGGSSVRR